MIRKIIIYIGLILPMMIVGQQEINPFVEKVKFPNGINRCSTVEMDSIRRKNDSSLPSRAEYEQWLQTQITEYKIKQANKQIKATVVTIPVVIHVVHNGDQIGVNENISDAQAMSQIYVLNQDYRRMIGTNGYNTNPVGADVEIEFCLAQFDTAGNAFNGIDRVQTLQTDWSSTTLINSTLKPSTIWDPTKYMNIWTVDFGASGILAFTQLPDNSTLSGIGSTNGAATTDGIVINYSVFGSVEIAPGGNYQANYDRGRTLTHEVGHFFGLMHIWGDGACGVDDFCADTPESDAANYGCVQDSSCGSPDMIENYMDFTSDVCMNVFTEDQKIRMRTVLAVSPRRMELINSTVCGFTGNLDVGISDIYVPGDSVCDTAIHPVVKLFNFGSDTLYSAEIHYEYEGNVNIYQWSGGLPPGNFDLVNLPVFTGYLGGHSYSAYTVNPNGGVDVNGANNSTSKPFYIVHCEEQLGKISNNVFTPNDDGVNDVFVLDIPQFINNNNTVVFYNRWGDVLREFVNYNNNDVIWDGKDKNGNIVSNGTYFYVIEIPSINYSNSGWVQLIK